MIDTIKNILVSEENRASIIVVLFILYSGFMVWFGHKITLKSGKIIQHIQYDYRKPQPYPSFNKPQKKKKKNEEPEELIVTSETGKPPDEIVEKVRDKPIRPG